MSSAVPDVTCGVDLEIELPYPETCRYKTWLPSSPHYQVNEIEWGNGRNRPERKNNYWAWCLRPHKTTTCPHLWGGKKKRRRFSKRKLSQMQGHDGETSFVTWGAGFGVTRSWPLTPVHGSITPPQHSSSCGFPRVRDMQPRFTAWKRHFTSSLGMISPRSFSKEHNTNLAANHWDSWQYNTDWNSPARLWKTPGFFFFPFLFQREKNV